MNNSPIIACENLRKSFADGEVLSGVNLAVHSGETICIAGASGSGKTTLLHLLGGLDNPDGGYAAAGGKKWNEMNAAESASHKNRMLGFVFQFHLLLPEFSAQENAAMPLLIRGESRDVAMQAAAEVLQRVGLSSCANKRPGQMSGGERQRTAVARALAGNPECVLADEPTGNLDRKNAETVFSLMLESAAASGAAVIVVSHDEHLAARAKRRARLADGVLQE